MRKKRIPLLFAVLTLVASLPAYADNLHITTPDQTAFDQVARDVTASFDYHNLSTAAATGITGLSVGGFASFTPVHNRNAWKTLTGKDPGTLTTGGLTISKGLPGGLGVGAFVAGLSGSSATIYGAQLRYSLLKGTLVTPALTLRGAYTGAANIDDFDYRSYDVDATISQPLLLFTPYAGIGYVWGKLSPKDGIALHDASANRTKGFVGVKFSIFGVLQMMGEYERLGSDNIYNLRLGLAI